MRIRSGNVAIVAFDESKTDAIFAVRNHPSVRAGMRDNRPLTIEGHRTWVEQNLVRMRTVDLFVVESGAHVVGITLLRNFRAGSAEIGVMLVNAEQRPLLCYKAAHLTAYYGLEILGLERLLSYVPRHNNRALLFNRHCGFEDTGSELPEYHELVLTRDKSRADRTHMWFRERYGIRVVD